MMNNEIQKELIIQLVVRMEENTTRILKCLEELNETDIWIKPNSSSNSIANLVLHLRGNVSQYILSSLGNQKDTRDRNSEFTANEGLSRSELQNMIADTIEEVLEIIRNQTQEELLKSRIVQGFDLTGIGIIIHVLEHFAYHTGQIAFQTKQLKNKDLGFYDGVNLNTHNPEN